MEPGRGAVRHADGAPALLREEQGGRGGGEARHPGRQGQLRLGLLAGGVSRGCGPRAAHAGAGAKGPPAGERRPRAPVAGRLPAGCCVPSPLTHRHCLLSLHLHLLALSPSVTSEAHPLPLLRLHRRGGVVHPLPPPSPSRAPAQTPAGPAGAAAPPRRTHGGPQLPPLPFKPQHCECECGRTSLHRSSWRLRGGAEQCSCSGCGRTGRGRGRAVWG